MKTVEQLYNPTDIAGLITGLPGNRAFPTRDFRQSDPFLMLDHIGPASPGTSWRLSGKGHDHPHRGFETLTLLFEGRMSHRDSRGNKPVLESGDVQRMHAGSGIIHGGGMQSDTQTGRFHEVQLWVNVPKDQKMTEPEVQSIRANDIPSIETETGYVRILSGSLSEMTGPIDTKVPTQIAHFHFKRDGRQTVSGINKGFNAMVYTLEGNGTIADRPIRQGQLALLSESGNTLTISGEPDAQFLMISGRPLNEQVVFGGPFVMNTQEEIEQAYQDFQAGLFGTVNTQEA
jgi:redox-sensitive bicupin YhaK (pirin superfamily)